MGGYGGVGHYYWVLASDGEKVTWLSDHDYGVHLAPIAEFEVPAGCACRLAWRPCRTEAISLSFQASQENRRPPLLV